MDVKSAGFIAKVFVSLGLIGFLLYKIGGSNIIVSISQANPLYLSLAALLIVFEVSLLVFAWHSILRLMGHKVKYRQLCSIYLIGHFIGTFLPVNLGADIARTYSLFRVISNGPAAASSIITLRLSGALSLLFLVLLTPVVIDSGHPEDWIIAFFWTSLLGLISVLIAVNRFHGAKKWFGRWAETGSGFIKKNVGKLYLSLRESMAHPKVLGAGVALLIVVQGVRIFTAYVIGSALGSETDFYWFIVFVPLVMLLIQLPISFSGMGVREAGLVYFMTQVGMSAHIALSIALVTTALGFLFNLAGGVLYLSNKWREISNNRLRES